MSAGGVAALVVVAWVLSGLVAAVVLARSGRESRLWWGITLVLGPFSLPIALDLGSDRRIEVRERKPLTPSPTGTQASFAESRPRVRALAAVDGSAESREALGDAAQMLGDRLGSLVLVHVLDYDTALIDGDQATARGHALLADAASVLPPQVEAPVAEVTVGRPADALIEMMERESADLLILGHHGEGGSKAVLGSVSDEVVRRSAWPVLISGSPRRDA